MITDKELLTQSLEKYVTKTIDSLFGISSLPAQTLLRYGVRNMVDKYGAILDIFTTKDGIINVPLVIDALKSEVRARGGIQFWNIKFTDRDLEEILNIYNDLKDKNNA
jgi:hypothetical protein